MDKRIAHRMAYGRQQEEEETFRLPLTDFVPVRQLSSKTIPNPNMAASVLMILACL